MNSVVSILTRRAGLIVGLGLIVAAIGAYFTTQLYKNLRTDMEELLPTNARSVIDLKEVTTRLESSDNIVILVFAENTEASKRFVTDLAK
jgi:predicted RND superfamily exporter protein